MSELSKRIKEIRTRMKRTQTEFGALGGVSKSSQVAYEVGRTEPSSTYLANLAEVGVNVVYLLTGRQFIPPPDGDEFYSLLGVWLNLSDRHREDVTNFATWLWLANKEETSEMAADRQRAADYLDAVQRGEIPEYNPALSRPESKS